MYIAMISRNAQVSASQDSRMAQQPQLDEWHGVAGA
jgi:hypothetical protein